MSALPLQFITSYFVDQSRLLPAKLFSLWCAVGTQCYLRNLKPCFVIRMLQRRLAKLKASTWSCRAEHKPSPALNMWYKYDTAIDELNLFSLTLFVHSFLLWPRKHEIKTWTALKSHSHPTVNYEMKEYYIAGISSCSNKKIHILHFLKTLLMGLRWELVLE